ncbi:MFS transporter [Marmoricola sp. RAF53]|uniref:MFS transporter n=1 Tax=Marmoricola sp. RAF53 TaxID=3233059 RepID=UPI003F9A33ED
MLIVIEAVQFSILTPLLPALDEDLALGSARLGQATGAYLFGILLAIIPAGAVVARLGFRNAALVGLILLGGGGAAVGWADSFAVLVLARTIQGVGSAVTWAAAMAAAVSAVRPERRGSAVGAVLAAAFVGTFLGPLVGGLAVGWGRPAVFALLAGTCAVMASAVSSWPRAHGEVVPGRPTGLRLWRPPPRTSAAMMITLGAISIAGGARVTLPVVELDHEIGTANIALVFSLCGLAMAAVAVGVGRLSDRFRPRRLVAVGAAVSAVCSVFLAYVAEPVALVGLVIALGCFVQVGMTAGFASITTENANAGLDPAVSWTYLNLVWTGGFLLGNVGPSGVAGVLTTSSAWLVVALAISVAGPVTLLVRRPGRVGPSRPQTPTQAPTTTGEGS